ncbi:MAG: LLM class flavin-dependent oxidoreductase [Chloroflexi bacterium]|nr:LLM class flavin-dependent oxidoreductase [Chloroflexota bacterium]
MENGAQRPAPRFDWFIPIDGDGAHIGTFRAERPPTFDYLRRVVETAETEGYSSLLIPTRFTNGLFEENAPLAETWTTVTALAAVTSRIRFLVAVRPGFISTGLFAQMAATLDQISGGRLDLNVVPGGIQGEFERFGEDINHDQRYERAEEFIAALRALWARPEPVHFEGQTIRLRGAVVSPGPVNADGPVGRGPQFYVGGASPRALSFAGRQADVYLAWIQPQEEIAELLARTRDQFAVSGRRPVFGLRTHLVVRSSEAEAWDAADDLLSEAAAVVEQQRQAVFAGTAMVGQRAQVRADVSERAPRLWNGISRVRVNCGTAIVGDPEQVAAELFGYWRLGIDEFILSGYPHVEECRRVASEVLPILRTAIARESSDTGLRVD